MKMRSRRLVVGTMVAGLTVAALAAPSAAARNNNNGNNNRSQRLSAQCSYPPVSAPTVSLASTASHVAVNRRFTLYGSVDVNGCGLRNRGVALFTAPSPSGPFDFDSTSSTDNSGVYSISVRQTATTYYRVASSAGGGFSMAPSNVVLVTTP